MPMSHFVNCPDSHIPIMWIARAELVACSSSRHCVCGVRKLLPLSSAMRSVADLCVLFPSKTLLPGADCSSSGVVKPAANSLAAPKGTSDKVYAHQMVRTDSREQKLDAFLQPPNNPLSTAPKEAAAQGNARPMEGAAGPQDAEMADVSAPVEAAPLVQDTAVPGGLRNSERLSPEGAPSR